MDKTSARATIVFLFGLLGFILAAIEEVLYTNGYMLDLYLTDASQLPGLQIVTIVASMLIGCVFVMVI